jgi:long-chain fatty acid transport protein
MKLKKIAVLVAIAAGSTSAFATNGMNMEGYGPVATAMGGASMAYDNGNAGMINNPATLGFMKSGESRLDVAIGGLHPSIASGSQSSTADAFYMPAVGYIRKDGQLSWGFGMMAQGGMGAEYADSAVWGTMRNMTNTATQTSSLKNMSELGVGRLMAPFSYEVNNNLMIGGSLDFVWAGMDIQWTLDGAHFGDSMPGGTKRFASASGSMVGAFADNLPVALGGTGAGGCGAGGCMDNVNWGQFDFLNSSKFSQRAKSTGWAANLGFVYKMSPNLTVGAVYHPKTRLGDMKTGDNDATVRFNVDLTAAGNFAFGGPLAANPGQTIPVTGKVTIKDFQWPETFGFGLAYKVSDQLMIVSDFKYIRWAEVMKSFKMTFNAAATQSSAAITGFFGGKALDFDYKLDWKNQSVFMLGFEYRPSTPLALRAGVNIANDPVKSEYMTPLFPATIKNHLTFGAGYMLDKTSSVDFSLTHAPKVTVTNTWGAVAGTNQTVTHSQTNWQLMYGHRF